MPENTSGGSSWRKMTRRELSARYDELLRHSAHLRAALYSIGDAVIITNIDGRISLMNPTAERLTGWAEHEALESPIEQIFRIADEETRAMLESPVARVLREDAVVRLSPRAVLINRDGRAIPIGDTSAPIRTEAGDVTGVILIFQDQTSVRTTLHAVQQAREFAENIIATVREPLLVLSRNLRVVSANRAFYQMFHTTSADTLYQHIYELGNRQWDIPELRRLLEEILPHNVHFDGYEVTHDFQHIGRRTMLLNARRVQHSDEFILLAIEDVTERVRAEQRLHMHLQRLRALRTIDQAIISALDMRAVLDILLDQITSYLYVDAASILLLDPYAQTLTYTAERGLRSRANQRTTLYTGEGYAGRVALDRRMLFITDLRESELEPSYAPVLQQEAFVTYCGVPLIAKGQVKGVLELFHRTRLDPDQDWLDFLETLAVQAAIAIDSVILFETMQRSNAQMILAYEATIRGWAHALDLRDQETEGHSRRVTELTVRLARAAGLSDEQIAHIRRGALLHDIGKLGVPDSILRKPGQLTEEEWAAMRQHPDYAYTMLSPIEYLRPVLDIPYSHHERWDGTGYPRGLKGEQIPLAARLFAVADVWDALQSDRPYRARWQREEALDYIRSQAGTHFDPDVVALFLKVIGEAPDDAAP
ncbi:MAG: histidine kinase [Roseiflexus castenholzii]|uniref:HD domain-containing phosphohydrolase n=1 Tax=Roseiflexus castenholzii TaxID=120962 RepID=UPI000CC3549A|nr:MAG: histidine kinase [Roseiflexus castenholzii]